MGEGSSCCGSGPCVSSPLRPATNGWTNRLHERVSRGQQEQQWWFGAVHVQLSSALQIWWVGSSVPQSDASICRSGVMQGARLLGQMPMLRPTAKC